MKTRLVIVIKHHKKRANNSGFIPTFAIEVRDNPAPMKKSVNTSNR